VLKAQAYTSDGQATIFDEMLRPDGTPRPAYAELVSWFSRQTRASFRQKQQEALAIFSRLGITFAVYGSSEANEKIIPFDLIPRIVSAAEWRFLERGFDPPANVYAHIIGIDIVRTGDHGFYVLEDNLRTPSGVSYMLENREAMMRLFPELFAAHRVAPVERYPELLRQTLESVRPKHCDGDPTIAILTPGIYNSAYFEHAFLADQMGVELVQGSDLIVDEGALYMRTIRGKERLHVIYRRVDDAFLDPLNFRPDSMLGVPGLFDLYRAGKVTIVNAPGTGIADDKAVYAYVPDIVSFYTGEKPILENVKTFRCSIDDERSYVLDRLDELVVKEVHGSGGYGMLIGPHATKKERADFADRIKARPANYIAQPTLSLSTCPSFCSEGIDPRHVDLRPFVLVGDRIRVTPGGLTRVALKKGSLVVNSSQGGGTKDTWILESDGTVPVQSQPSVQSQSQTQSGGH
jgi:uncharacterized circularly permuted ATP-grasp superfamily protein